MTKAITSELRALRRAARTQPYIPPMPWAKRAACQGHDPEDWMDDRPGRPTAAVRAVCSACPVRPACLAHALAYDEPWGMWGGLTARERAAHRLGLPLPARDDARRPYTGKHGPPEDQATSPAGQLGQPKPDDGRGCCRCASLVVLYTGVPLGSLAAHPRGTPPSEKLRA